MEIRVARSADLAEVYRLLCLLEAKELPEQAFAQVYAHNQAEPLIRYLVAEVEGAVHGFVSLHMDWHLHHGTLVGEVQELIVDEAYRGQGIGKALLQAALCEAKQAGCSHLELNSNFRRTDAHAFYEHNGWTKAHYNFTYKRLHEE